MNAKGYLRIVNWAEYQHYRDRRPPWIKLHRDLLTSRTWVALDDASRVLAIACMVIAADTNNKIPYDPEFLQRRAYLSSKPDLSPLIAIHFLEVVEDKDSASGLQADASKMLAKRTKCYTRDRDRDRVETELTKPVEISFSVTKAKLPEDSPSEEPVEIIAVDRKSPVDVPVVHLKPGFRLPDWIPDRAWRDYEEMRQRIRKPMTDRARELAVRQLADLRVRGHPPEAVLQQSIFNSWQGLFEIKSGGGNGLSKAEQRQRSNLAAARRALEILGCGPADGAGGGDGGERDAGADRHLRKPPVPLLKPPP